MIAERLGPAEVESGAYALEVSIILSDIESKVFQEMETGDIAYVRQCCSESHWICFNPFSEFFKSRLLDSSSGINDSRNLSAVIDREKRQFLTLISITRYFLGTHEIIKGQGNIGKPLPYHLLTETRG